MNRRDVNKAVSLFDDYTEACVSDLRDLERKLTDDIELIAARMDERDYLIALTKLERSLTYFDRYRFEFRKHSRAMSSHLLDLVHAHDVLR